MPNRCTTCGGKFGLVHQMILTFGGHLYFCSKRCEKSYRKEQQQRIRAVQYQDWLRKENST
jgi:hypothetical protein